MADAKKTEKAVETAAEVKAPAKRTAAKKTAEKKTAEKKAAAPKKTAEKKTAAPKRAASMGRKTPCAIKLDKCYDCKSPDRLCRGLLVLMYPMGSAEMEVILVNEELGM